MYLINDTTRGMNLGASAGGVASTAAKGAAMGSVIGPWGTAIGAAVGAIAGLAQPKKHFSPWGFLYDDYPTRIYNNEIQIANARNSIAQIQGGAATPKPPGPPGKSGGPAYQESMLAIVPRYVPGAETQIAKYDRVLNEKGGAYERTYGAQLQVMQELAGQAQATQMAAAMRGSIPVSGSATSPVQLPSQIMPLAPQSPSTVQVSAPSYGLPPSPSSYGIPPTDAAQKPAPLQAGMFGDIGGYSPYVIGGLALLFVLFNAMDNKNSRSKKGAR